MSDIFDRMSIIQYKLVLLLGGSMKRDQKRTIKTCKGYLEHYKET
jgi:hypothetical protein